jgi:hypothetical protein
MKRSLFLGALLSIACGRSATTGPKGSVLLSAVVGSWSLVQGCGGIAYHCTGAANLPVPNVVVFSADGTTQLFRAGVKVASGTFRIMPSAADSLRAGTLVMNPGLEGPNETLDLNFSIEGQLMLAEQCCDRLTYSFIKASAPD